MSIDILATILSILLAALCTAIVFYYIRLPTLLGYLVVGAIVGPHALGLIPDKEIIQ